MVRRSLTDIFDILILSDRPVWARFADIVVASQAIGARRRTINGPAKCGHRRMQKARDRFPGAG
jgi:hypothetical protein